MDLSYRFLGRTGGAPDDTGDAGATHSHAPSASTGCWADAVGEGHRLARAHG
ncbi:hypothetical protein QBC33DRAFT_563456 [Phialemonium atrogriseum]|uniref:Uncharacterized protein n=1 Tax=Phialemonium atrogriseum TaxID=1093897 RepID=A0AAJ0FJ84_9PEZI|nr:uncharacterized protein QBC33DRAFT_563456 [Phialemonium atrogriseum]KAK1762855.1 hypothetical protein QBC33DRAFT_563456 [Phialemonium atrogriseum]